MENKDIKSSTILLGLIGLLAVAYLYVRHEKALAAQQTQVGGIGGTAGKIATGSGSYIRRVPLVGDYLDSAINAPVTNVVSGNTSATVKSVLTGGLSDVFGF